MPAKYRLPFRPFSAALLCLFIALSATLTESRATETTKTDIPPSRDELANATYQGIAPGPVTLSNGRWQGAPYQPGAATRPSAGLLDSLILHADLTGDGRRESIVTLWQNSGGTGTQHYLAVLARKKGDIINTHTLGIGDRLQILSGHIEDRGIVLNVVQIGPADAACCPSQKVRRSWMLISDENSEKPQLKEMPAYLIGRLSLADIDSIDWQLREPQTETTGEPSVNAATRQAITLRIEKSRVSGYGGCNRYQAAVIAGDKPDAQPGTLKIGNTLNTQMACPDDDLNREHRYLQQLSQVTHFSFRAGELLLTVNNTKKQSPTETLIFHKTSP